MWINFFSLLGGLALLVYSADRFVIGTASIARTYGVSPLLIGLTIVGLGTSAPEILVSAFASWQGNTGLAVGNALHDGGTAIARESGSDIVRLADLVSQHVLLHGDC